jgi:hypothetical protein
MPSSDPDSLRNRFLTRKVARSVVDVPALGAVGAGVAIGLLAGLGPIGAIVGGAVFLCGRVAFAIPRRARNRRDIDPYRLGEPWNRLVRDALGATHDFDATVRDAKDGPLRDQLGTIGRRIDDSLFECWRVAQGGDTLTRARSRLDVAAAQRELDALRSGPQNDTTAHTIQALEAQLATATRLDATIADARDKLRLLNARLDEAVSRSVELSATSSSAVELSAVGDDVASIVGEMEALRQAVEVVSESDRTMPG